jgi:folate-binding protein YgfZ
MPASPQDISTADMFSLEQYQALRQGAGLIDRSGKGRLRLTGADRRSYLQGLLTNDIDALGPGQGCYACLLTAQGRMIADMYVMELGDAILMDLEGDITAKVFAHLEQFIFAEDVQVEDVSASLAQIGVFGPTATTVLSRVIGPLEALRPLENRSTTWNGRSLTVVGRDDVGVGGFDLVIDRAAASDLVSAIREAGAIEVGDRAVETCRIEAGHPVFHKDMTEETIPLEAGIEDQAISVTKGCYVGQEIIIRVLHRGGGRVARRLVGLRLPPDAAVPTSGDPIRAGDREIGRVTSATWSPSLQHPIALGYVHRDFVTPGTRVALPAADAEVTERTKITEQS